MKNAVGMIGLGIMGSAMASNLVKAGFRVVGHDVVPKARAAHRRAGGVVGRSNGDVARRAPIVVTSLPSAAALEAVAEEIVRARGRAISSWSRRARCRLTSSMPRSGASPGSA